MLTVDRTLGIICHKEKKMLLFNALGCYGWNHLTNSTFLNVIFAYFWETGSHKVWNFRLISIYADLTLGRRQISLHACANLWLSLFIFCSFCLCHSSFLPSLCLPQKVTRQQQEINNLAQKRTTVDEDVALMKKELTSLREQLVNKDHELKVDGVNFPWQRGSLRLQVSFLCFTNHYYSPVILFACSNCNRKIVA